MSETPEFLNDFQSGEKPAQGSTRQERLKAQGIEMGETLEQMRARLNKDAWASSGSQEDPGAEFQRVSSKQGRGNVEMPDHDIHEQVRELAKQGGRPLHPESGLPMEPETTESIVGYSEEKKAALKKAKKSSKKAKE